MEDGRCREELGGPVGGQGGEKPPSAGEWEGLAPAAYLRLSSSRRSRRCVGAETRSREAFHSDARVGKGEEEEEEEVGEEAREGELADPLWGRARHTSSASTYSSTLPSWYRSLSRCRPVRGLRALWKRITVADRQRPSP
jgi:hypothetical protein